MPRLSKECGEILVGGRSACRLSADVIDLHLIETREEINLRRLISTFRRRGTYVRVWYFFILDLGFNFLLRMIWQVDDTLFHNALRGNLKFQVQIGTTEDSLITVQRTLVRIVPSNVSLRDKGNMWYLTLTRYGVNWIRET